MSVPVTAVLASLLAALFLALSMRVVKLRRANQVSLGHGGVPELERAIRGQANFSEYAPFFVALTLIAELQGINALLIGVVALAFLIGRAMHGYCFAYTDGRMVLRVRGMQLTATAIVVMAVLDFVSVVL